MERKILLIGLALTMGAVGMFLYERNRGPAAGAAVDPSVLVPQPAPAIRGVARRSSNCRTSQARW